MTETNYAVAPGEYLTEWLEENGVSRGMFAHQLGVVEPFVIRLVEGEIEVTAPLARGLEDLTGIPVKSWLAWEVQYAKDQARLASTELRAHVEETKRIHAGRRAQLQQTLAEPDMSAMSDEEAARYYEANADRLDEIFDTDNPVQFEIKDRPRHTN